VTGPVTDADVLVIGGGHNGLAAAVRLARGGRRVVVLERRDRLGGLAAAEELHPGYTVPGVLHDDGRVPERVVREMGLAEHGLAFTAPPPVYVPAPDGPGFLLARDPAEAQAELAAHSPPDAAAYEAWRGWLARVGGFVTRLVEEPPPPLAPSGLGDLLGLGRRALALRLLGRAGMTELLRVVPMCAADWLRERFASPLVAEALAAPAVANTFSGPWSAGTAANLLLAEAAAGRGVAGGPAALVEALTSAARSLGVELRTGAEVARIRVEKGRAAGVSLASGEEIGAPVVVATCDPKQTFLQLLPPEAVDLGTADAFRAFRARGTAAKVHLALSGPLEFRGREGEAIAAARVGGGHVDELERAHDAVKYRRFSERPHLDVRVPTVSVPGLAPEGHHVVSILVSFAPYDLEGGWTPQRREALGNVVVAALARHCPGLEERIVAREVLTPQDLEERCGTTGGHLHHGEHALDQLLLTRPTPGTARYATPIPGLYLAGAGSHPGGGLTALPGWLGAGVVEARRD
jgi:phytoene dehydrogenase-like protein